MIDRQLIADAAFAILLVLPAMALARPSTTPPTAFTTESAQPQQAIADQAASDRRFSLLG